MGWTLQDGRHIPDDATFSEYCGVVAWPHRNADRLAESAPDCLHDLIVAASVEWYVQRDGHGGWIIADAPRFGGLLGEPVNVRHATDKQSRMIDTQVVTGITSYYDLRHPDTDFRSPMG
jgi:hypothetical protein